MNNPEAQPRRQVLFEDVNIGPVRLKNRLVMAPMVMCYASATGEITEQTIAHFVAQARGGVGLIIVEASYVHISGKGFHSEIAIDRDELVPRLHLLTNAVHAHGARIAMQLYHGGVQAHQERPVGPSAIGRKKFPPENTPRALETTEVEEMVEVFAQAAGRAQQAQFDMVEVHGTHGYLIAQFFSPLTNTRTDKYGVDPGLFAEEIVKAIKARCGAEYPLLFRLEADEFEEGGVDLQQARELAERLETAGVDAFHVTGGNYDTSDRLIPPSFYDEQGYFFELASGIKTAVDVPVISGGMIQEWGVAAGGVENENVDLVFLGRQLIADPAWPRKVQQGHEKAIVPCIACEECIDRIFFQEPVNCSVNPLKGFEYQFSSEHAVPRALESQRVMVIGGGFAGLEVARVAQDRGHEVTVWEKSAKLGGIINVVIEERHKWRIKRFLELCKARLHASGVHVETGREVTPDLIRETRPDVVVLATGSVPLEPDLPGIERAKHAEEVFAETANVAANGAVTEVLIAGGGFTGCELALKLARVGKQVTIVEKLHELAPEEPILSRMGLLNLLHQEEVVVRTGKTIIEVLEKALVTIDETGRRETSHANVVVNALGRVPCVPDDLRQAAEEVTTRVEIIGDARRPRKILDAIHEGFWTAVNL